MKLTRAGFGLGALSVVLAASACGSSSPRPESTDTTVSVVASTNVYGDIVKQIAGSAVTVTSIISDPVADPHAYEANAQNQLAVSNADVVVENGGGYDDFIDTMLSAANNSDATVLNVVDISGKTASDGQELNEHVWYDFPTIGKLADQLVGVLSAKDSANASTFSANASVFKQKLATLEAAEASVKSARNGTGVAITEPVPLYLLEACGLSNKTPEEFSEAIEEGADVPVAVLRETLDLFTHKRVTLLVYNEQTFGPQTQQVVEAANANGIAVVSVTETLPQGKDYITWMTDNLSAIGVGAGLI